MWMNEYDIERMLNLFDPAEVPNLAKAAKTLDHFATWTNANSDGWAHWPKPAKAATKIMDLLQNASVQAYNGTLRDASDADLKRALTPIKSFLTRQGAEHAEVLA